MSRFHYPPCKTEGCNAPTANGNLYCPHHRTKKPKSVGFAHVPLVPGLCNAPTTTAGKRCAQRPERCPAHRSWRETFAAVLPPS